MVVRKRDPLEGNLAATLDEMGRHPLLELADELSGEAELRRKEEGDAGPLIARLVDFLQGKDHALIGGLAVRAHIRMRPTGDFDVMIDPKHWTEMRAFLAAAGAEAVASVEDTYLYTFPAVGMDLDVRLAKSPLDQEAMAHVVKRPAGRGKTLAVVKPDHLVAMKVKAYSERKQTPKGDQDRKDVVQLLRQKLADEQVVRDILRRLRPDLLAELDEMLKP